MCDSDTQSAPSPTNTLPQTSPGRDTISPSQAKLTTKEQADTENNIRSTVTKEDYDSSATETADEGIGGTAENESNVLQHSNSESDKKDTIIGDVSVSDILSDVIEKQFTKEHSNREVRESKFIFYCNVLFLYGDIHFFNRRRIVLCLPYHPYF